MSGWGGVDDYLVRIQALIEQHGWAVQGVFGTEDDPAIPFGYTVGLTLKDLPEVIIFGLSPALTQSTLNTVATRMIERGAHQAGELIDYVFQGPYEPMAVDVDARYLEQEYLTVVGRLYGDRNPSALQLVIPDKEQRFPWDDGYAMDSPLLGQPPQWVLDLPAKGDPEVRRNLKTLMLLESEFVDDQGGEPKD